MFAESLGCRDKDRHFVDARFEGIVKTSFVWHKRRIDRASATRDAAHHFGCIAKLRDPLCADKTGHFDLWKSRSGELIDELNLDRSWNTGGFVLQAIARTNFCDSHLGSIGGHDFFSALRLDEASTFRCSSRAARRKSMSANTVTPTESIAAAINKITSGVKAHSFSVIAWGFRFASQNFHSQPIFSPPPIPPEQ